MAAKWVLANYLHKYNKNKFTEKLKKINLCNLKKTQPVKLQAEGH